jgi:hypothetical protein
LGYIIIMTYNFSTASRKGQYCSHFGAKFVGWSKIWWMFIRSELISFVACVVGGMDLSTCPFVIDFFFHSITQFKYSVFFMHPCFKQATSRSHSIWSENEWSQDSGYTSFVGVWNWKPILLFGYLILLAIGTRAVVVIAILLCIVTYCAEPKVVGIRGLVKKHGESLRVARVV